ncbi:MAG TPA: tetratricopeptide repeat protein [Terrimicrobiaceae bacterium]
MHCSGLRVCFAILFGIFAGCSFAQKAADNQDLTADELAVNASSFYAQGRYDEAAAMYRKFLTDFGSAEAAQPAVRQMRYPLAMCLLRLQRFSEALDAIRGALACEPPIETAHRQDLLFWRGVCEMQEKQGERARETLEQFVALFPADSERDSELLRKFPAAQKVSEARLLMGACLLLDGKCKEAADYYAHIKQSFIPINRGRATVLQLHALLEAGEENAARKVVVEEFPRMGDLLQLVSFQTLTFELGARYLERNEPRNAIICLQRVWSADRLLKHQEACLEDLESKLQAVEADPRGDPYAKLLYGQMIAKVKREIENFRKIESFDAAVRLRLAAAYQAMHRYRESALILEAMLNDMPPDRIVESASVNLVQCWSAIECWSNVVEAATVFTRKFPKSDSVPLIVYMQGVAEQRRSRYAEAIALFDAILGNHPASDYAPRAKFMKAFCLLQAERGKEAIAEFEQFQERYPLHELAQDALYWRGIGHSLHGQFDRCRQVMDDYLDAHKAGRYRTSAAFRKAYCAQQAKDYQTSIKELSAFLRDHPGAEECNEARILLGDALMSQGSLEEGIAALEAISREDVKLYTEGVFKIGKAYKRMEEFEKLRDHMAQFKTNYPRSPRVAEAIFWIGWTYRQQGMPGKARDVYWEAISEYGDDAAIWSVDDLFAALSKLYKGDDEAAEFSARLGNLRVEAERTGKRKLATRASWAQAIALKSKDPAHARKELIEVSERLNAQTDNPLLLADCADALLAAGKETEAERMFRDLVKWNPRAPQKDRALAALGRIEMQRGNESSALEQFDRFEREITGSRLFGEVMLFRAELLQKDGRTAEARGALERLLTSEYALGQEKAKALYLIGEIYMNEARPDLAIPYFQRLYVMHGRWRDWVAKAYYRSGEAFERLNDQSSARRTYQELAEREDLADFEEALKARGRLNLLGGSLSAEEMTPAKG